MDINALRRLRAIEQLKDSDHWQTVDWLPEIDSTNSEQKRRAVQNELPRLPWLLVADRQTGGRGRAGNVWWSPDGCLMFSVALRFEGEILERIGQLPLVVGVSLAGAIENQVDSPERVKVKWPNDLFVGEKKLAGILIESVVGSGNAVWIIGVGMNVVVPLDEADLMIRQSATSLHREVTASRRAELSIESVLLDLLDGMAQCLSDWQRDEDWLNEHWTRYAFLNGKRVCVALHDGHVFGRCLGIDAAGALVVDDEQRGRTAILSGVVESWES